MRLVRELQASDPAAGDHFPAEYEKPESD
jgi:hypothetical protein